MRKQMKRLKRYRTLNDASVEYNIEPEKLQEMVDQGSLRAALCDDELAILEDDVRAYVAKRDISHEQFKHLEGNPIMLSEASKKYDLNTGSLWRWIGKGQIHILKQDGYRVFVNEADVAYTRALINVKGLRPGQSLF